jgi:zinc protease
MLDEGAGELDALQFGDAVQSLGATLGTSADRETVTVSLAVLKRNFDRAASLLADAVCRPRFDPKEWDRVQKLHVEQLKQEEEEPELVASRVAARILFGDKSPCAWPVEGTPDTVAKLRVADLRRTHEQLLRPDQATVLVAGDLTVDEAKAVLERTLGDWRPEQPDTRPARPAGEQPFAPREKPGFVIVDRPGAVQTVVLFAMPGPRYATPRRVQYSLLNGVLGGSFTSRLIQNLREAHGYTYGVHSSFMMRPSFGYFVARSSVHADVTCAAVGELLKELKRAQAGDVTSAEAEKAGAILRSEVIQSFAGLDGLLNAASGPVAAGLPFETLGQDFRALAGPSAGEVNLVAKGAPLDRGVLVLVGDKDVIMEQLAKEGTGFAIQLPPPTEVNVRGGPVP